MGRTHNDEPSTVQIGVYLLIHAVLICLVAVGVAGAVFWAAGSTLIASAAFGVVLLLAWRYFHGVQYLTFQMLRLVVWLFRRDT